MRNASIWPSRPPRQHYDGLILTLIVILTTLITLPTSNALGSSSSTGCSNHSINHHVTANYTDDINGTISCIECNLHGICTGVSHRCDCDHGWGSIDCSYDFTTDSARSSLSSYETTTTIFMILALILCAYRSWNVCVHKHMLARLLSSIGKHWCIISYRAIDSQLMCCLAATGSLVLLVPGAMIGTSSAYHAEQQHYMLHGSYILALASSALYVRVYAVTVAKFSPRTATVIRWLDMLLVIYMMASAASIIVRPYTSVQMEGGAYVALITLHIVFIALLVVSSLVFALTTLRSALKRAHLIAFPPPAQHTHHAIGFTPPRSRLDDEPGPIPAHPFASGASNATATGTGTNNGASGVTRAMPAGASASTLPDPIRMPSLRITVGADGTTQTPATPGAAATTTVTATVSTAATTATSVPTLPKTTSQASGSNGKDATIMGLIGSPTAASTTIMPPLGDNNTLTARSGTTGGLGVMGSPASGRWAMPGSPAELTTTATARSFAPGDGLGSPVMELATVRDPHHAHGEGVHSRRGFVAQEGTATTTNVNMMLTTHTTPAGAATVAVASPPSLPQPTLQPNKKTAHMDRVTAISIAIEQTNALRAVLRAIRLIQLSLLSAVVALSVIQSVMNDGTLTSSLTNLALSFYIPLVADLSLVHVMGRVPTQQAVEPMIAKLQQQRHTPIEPSTQPAGPTPAAAQHQVIAMLDIPTRF